jgi:Flp pilus assembly protein TadD
MQAVGNRVEARKAYERALYYDPGASYALTNLCYLSFLEGSLGEALGECGRAVAMAPDSMPAHNNLALIYAEQGKLDLARAEFAAVGEPAAVDFNMGMIYMARKQYAKAEAAFTSALEARPRFAAAATRARQAASLALQLPATRQDEQGDHHD